MMPRGVTGRERLLVVIGDNLLVLAAFLPMFLTGIATGFGATPLAGWSSPILVLGGICAGAGMLLWNGGVLAGRGSSIAMGWLGICLVDQYGRHPIGTSRAFARAFLTLLVSRGGVDQPLADRWVHAILMWGHIDDVRSSR